MTLIVGIVFELGEESLVLLSSEQIIVENLSIKARLNVNADKIATKHVTIPKNTHISSVPLIMYINNKHIHYKFNHNIRRHALADDGKMFLRKKYQ